MFESFPGCDQFAKGGRHACLVLPGFLENEEARLVVRALREAGLAVVLYETCRSDETSGGAFSSNWRLLLDGVRETYARLDRAHDSVAVVGFSVGGALALILAAEYPVSSVVAVCPALKLRDPLRLCFSRQVRARLTGEAIRARDTLTLMRLARRSLFAVVAPALILQPEYFGPVHPRAAKLAFSGISSREKRLVRLTQPCRGLEGETGYTQEISAIKNHLCHALAPKTLVN